MSLDKRRKRAIEKIYGRVIADWFKYGYKIAMQYDDPENHQLSALLRFHSLPKGYSKLMR